MPGFANRLHACRAKGLRMAMSDDPERRLTPRIVGGVGRALWSIARRVRQAAIATLAVLLSGMTAEAEDRALKLFFTHTGERTTITFKRDGRFDPRGLAQINRFLRDWRKNEPTRMDPRLLDLVWEVYHRSGARDYIHVVSAYRSPTTNKMLRSRSRSSGVAKTSQHMLGKAMDFYIPGVKLQTLRALAMQLQVGGVGYYPRSGSPFVHLDVGRVRAWPRMSRQELASIFPNGRTMHVPADGRPLPGYAQAVANHNKHIQSGSIENAATADEEDAVETGQASPSAGPIEVALVPVPSSRAERALSQQAGQNSVTARANGQAPIADLSLYAVPIPNFRPPEKAVGAAIDEIQTASIGAAEPEQNTRKFLPMLREVPTSGLTLSARSAASLPMSGSSELQAGIGSVSARRLLSWALHLPERAPGLSAPYGHRRLIILGSDRGPYNASLATAP
jgi:uncharacterized protein YcbK (DUF882 family)